MHYPLITIADGTKRDVKCILIFFFPSIHRFSADDSCILRMCLEYTVNYFFELLGFTIHSRSLATIYSYNR